MNSKAPKKKILVLLECLGNYMFVNAFQITFCLKRIKFRDLNVRQMKFRENLILIFKEIRKNNYMKWINDI
jgi:hypothetical protein